MSSCKSGSTPSGNSSRPNSSLSFSKSSADTSFWKASMAPAAAVSASSALAPLADSMAAVSNPTPRPLSLAKAKSLAVVAWLAGIP